MVVYFLGRLLCDTRHIVISLPWEKSMANIFNKKFYKKHNSSSVGSFYSSCGVTGIGSFLLSPITMSK